MTPLDIALKYLDIFYSGKDISELSLLLADDLTFDGPLYKFNSANDYMDSLRKDPPQEMRFKLIKSFENKSYVCLIYQFSKPGISIPLAQMFKIDNNKICRILLIFDTKAFK